MLESLVDHTFYVGQTSNLVARLKRHNSGYMKSTKSKVPYKLVYFEEHKTRADAMSRELEIKKKYNTERRRRLVLSFDTNRLNTILGL